MIDSDIISMTVEDLISNLISERDWKGRDVVLLLGAGCSQSSGVPGAADLARRWLIEARSKDRTALAHIDESQVAERYYEICSKRWGTHDQIKREIGRFTANASPGIGYITLAKVLSAWSGQVKLNTILTTNFDNLIEQSFLLFTSERPVVIPDPKLINSFGYDDSIIQIIKLHGDSRYDPMNTAEATREIDQKVERIISGRFRNAVLLVLGYGGNDEGLGQAIAEWIDNGTFQLVVWVDTRKPGALVRKHAKAKDVYSRFHFVNHADFDSLMIRIASRMTIRQASSVDTDMHIFRYHDQLMWRLGLYGATREEVISPPPKRFTDYFLPFVESAAHIREGNPKRAREKLACGYGRYRGNTNYTVFYASVLKCIFGERQKYGKLCEAAVKRAPDHAAANAELAIYCKEIGEKKKAFQCFEKARQLSPLNWNNRLNYCGYLLACGKRKEGEAEYEECLRHVFERRHRLELAFYAYAHGLPHPGPLRDIVAYIDHNRSPNFDLQPNVAFAQSKNHLRPALVAHIAEVITNPERDATPVIDEIGAQIANGYC